MYFKKLSILIGMFVLSASSFGDSFRFEVGGSIGRTNIDFDFNNSDIDVDTGQLKGVFHFDRVDTSKRPLSEAAYLVRSNNISLTRSVIDTEYNLTFDVFKMDFYLPQAEVYIAPYYANIDSEGDDSNDNDFGVKLGMTPIDGLRVATTWSDERDYELNFEAKYVKELGNRQAINVEVAYEKSADDGFEKEDDYLGVGVDFYLDPSLSFGVAYHSKVSWHQALSDGTILSGDDAIGIRGEKFFNNMFSVNATYATSDDIDSWTVGVNFHL